MGYVSGSPHSTSLSLRGLNSQEKPATSQKQTMAEAQSSANKMFDKAKNSLHIATALLMDRSLTRMVRIAMSMCGAIERWYHDARVRLRSSSNSLLFHKEQSLGACLVPLQTVFGQLRDLNCCQEMGFTMSDAELPLSAGARDDAGTEAAEDEDDWMRRCFMLAFELVRARLRSAHVHGVLPGRLRSFHDGG